MQLQSGTLLQGGKYKIERVLGQGGFGITYLAKQELFDRHVCIKEFFFKDYCERGAQGEVTSCTTNSKELVDRFLNKFIKEARTISRLDHPNIVRILDIFQENGTAYYAMEYIEGCSLADKVNAQGALSEAVAVDYIKQVASALDYIHQRSINHLDVKPANIMVRQSDNKAILIDFGLSKQYDDQGGQTSTTPVGISHGYAPMEQYNQGGVSTFSPQTDIYSLGATLYKLVTGNTPPQAIEVFNEGLTGLPQSLSSNLVAAIKKTMQPKKGDRPQSIGEFTALLGGQFAAIPNSSISPSNSDESTRIIGTTNSKPAKNISSPQPTITKVEEAREKKGIGMSRVVIGIAIVCIAVFFLIGYGNNGNNNQSYSTSAPQQAANYSQTTQLQVGQTSDITSPHLEQPQKDSHGICNWNIVDLGLSIKWAGWNVGTSTAEGYGGLYQPSNIPMAGWQNGWRLPTSAETEELEKRCKWTWINYKGVYGMKVLGPNGNAIFLPASGLRDEDNTIIHRNLYGGYWSSDLSSSVVGGGYYISFNDFEGKTDEYGDPIIEYGFYRYLDKSVRLVHE